MPQPPRQPDQQPSGAAIAATSAPQIVGAVGPALMAAGATALIGQALATTVAALIDAFMRMARMRFADGEVFVLAELRRIYPDRPASELQRLVAQEAKFEQEFRRKMRERLSADLPEALALVDDAARRARLEAILERERRYTAAREEAMFMRALGKAEVMLLKKTSPEGGYWKLSPFVKEHTLDCLAVGEKFWPWIFLEEFQPPVHHGCACHLIGLDEAIEQGLMTRDQVPDAADALARGRQALKDAREMEEAIEEARAIGGALALEEAAQHSGAMVALYPARDVARALAQKGGEPVRDIHLTLAFLGKAADLKDVDRLKAVVEGFAHTCPPLTGHVSGIGKFTAGPDPVTYASADIPGLPEPRERLVTALRAAGFPPSTDHGFTPHITLAYDDRDIAMDNHPLRFDRVTLALGGKLFHYTLTGDEIQEAEVARWTKGYSKGGQFRPRRGGNPGERALRALMPHPKSPTALRGERRGRWTWVNGVYTRVPEADRWERRVAGHHYTSPPGSTNVYRDGKIIDGLGMVSDERRPAAARRAAPTPKALLDAGDRIRAELRADAAARLNRSPARGPLSVGDDASTVLALRDAGWRMDTARPGRLRWRNAHGASLDVAFDGQKVSDVDYQPTPPPAVAGKTLDGPPKSWDDFVQDGHAWTRDIADRFDAPVQLGTISIDGDLSDHAGHYAWNGDVTLGPDARIDIERAAAARADGRALTDSELGGVWAAYWAMAHEAGGHGVNTPSPDAYRGADAVLEEALTEENAHLRAAERLAEQGQDDVLRWRAAHPDAVAVQGVYRRGRGALGDILDAAGLADPFDRRVAIEDLKYRVPATERIRTLADMLVAADAAKDHDAAADRVTAALEHADTRGGALAGDQPPAPAAIAHLGYGRFADAKLTADGATLTLADGGVRRVERIPIPDDLPELAGLTDGSAIAAYAPGQPPTDGPRLDDGSPKTYRWVDSRDRGKQILAALAGTNGGAPYGHRDVWQPGDSADTVAPKIAAAKTWTTVRGVPVIRHLDGSYGVGHGNYDARRLTPAADARGAAAAAIARGSDGMASPGSDPGGGWQKLTHSGQGDLFPGEQDALDLAWAASDATIKPMNKRRDAVRGRKIGGTGPKETTGPIPAYDGTELTLGDSAGGSNGARWAFDDDGKRWLVKTYRGDRDRIATELVSNSIYRELGAPAARAGTITLDADEPDFRKIADADIAEPPLPKLPAGRRMSTGMIVAEPDGRLWIYEPKGHFGGYEHTFPKGGLQAGLTGQQNAHAELWEETGLHAHVTRFLGDYEGDTGTTRYYLAVRTGGEPEPGKPGETEAVKLVEPQEAVGMLNRQRDKQVLADALAAGLPTVARADAFPEPQENVALTYPTLDGKVRRFEPSEELGKHYMADALLANWDFVGAIGDNVLWADDGTPIRLDQGGTLEYRAQGQAKPFGPVPTEVWTMLAKGQGKRGVKVTEDQMRDQARHISDNLTDGRIDRIIDAAPFADGAMRERVRTNLKARRDWMADFADGDAHLPQPAEGQAAHAALHDSQQNLRLYPEQEEALFSFVEGGAAAANDALRAGEQPDKSVGRTINEMDSLLRHAQTNDDVVAYAPINLPGAGDEDAFADMIGRTLQERGFLGLHLEQPDTPAVLRLTVPSGSHAIYTGLWDEMPSDAPALVAARDSRIKVTGRRVADGRVVLDGVLSTQRPGRSLTEADTRADHPSYCTVAERRELAGRSPKAKGVTLRKDRKGFYVHTHRARSRSYPAIGAIPKATIDFIESTG